MTLSTHYPIKEGFISPDDLATWYFELGKNGSRSVDIVGVLDNILRKKLKFCCPKYIEVGSLKPIQMKPNDPPLKNVLEKNKDVMDLTKKLSPSGPGIIIEWSVNLCLKSNKTFKKVLVKPGDFQIIKGAGYPVITTMSDSETVDIFTNAHIWFPGVHKNELAKRNVPLLNTALETLDRELKPKKIEFEPKEFNGARLFKHGLKI